ncbi:MULTISPECIES: sulfate adenylyltransferase subunit CysD [unclassified Rathayibacter]|uniref:sulfate adenylyltransferase subunit CysD n=1 Tax=unclassified Rathayibacter TaxID=2609250 RepID=UPI00188D3406|nr:MULTISPECIES: sulfate adenylyltransferase subunit CysD [unclassified Rathayibacter]MBF4461215.1 sulfate adenylyltransferase subunit 2 [Rathayibacter sp. VKM Ac-2879]MBF4502626.1 sulfate adenylyltransferase subunit 2 [Rathayibacter sp. VKM Ac-2878]
MTITPTALATTVLRGSSAPRPSTLDLLEAEAIHILREVVAEFERPVLLFSGGKDSVVVLTLAAKAFSPGRVPFPVLHVDTGHNFPEVLAFRDETVARYGLQVKVARVQDWIDDGRLRERPDGTRNPLQTLPLLDAIAEGRHDVVLGGARRDEDKARAKERILSLRDEFGQWNPRTQRPELWSLYNGRHTPGQHVRAFPISNWTELDIWRYIERESIALPSLYFAHAREVFRRDGMWRAVGDSSPARPDETVETRRVRYRTVGDMSCTGAVESDAADLAAIVVEVGRTTVTERGATRADDRLSEAAMEDRKKDGYF